MEMGALFADEMRQGAVAKAVVKCRKGKVRHVDLNSGRLIEHQVRTLLGSHGFCSQFRRQAAPAVASL